jgi:hypothetical protein
MSEQAAAPVVGHRRLNRLLLVPDAGRCIVFRDDRKDIGHVVIVEMTIRGFPCMYVVLLATGHLNRSPA